MIANRSPCLRLVVVLLAAVMCVVAPAAAQDRAGEPVSPILIIDQERLFAESRLGELIASRIEEAAEALAQENRQIEEALIAEELELTERRAEMDHDAFRALAEAFDIKVQSLRAEQDEKERALSSRQDAERQEFLARIAPILGDLARERGAVAILDRRAVFLSAGRIDVTDAAIARLNDAIGVEGTERAAPPQVEDGLVLPPPGAGPGNGASAPVPPAE